MMQGRSGGTAAHGTVMIDATYLKAHRTASSLRVKRGPRAADRSHKGEIIPKLHAVTDANGRKISLFSTAGQVGDYIGVAALLHLPCAQ